MHDNPKKSSKLSLARSEFDKLVSFSQAKAKSGDREMLFGKINAFARKHGIDPDKGMQIEFTGGIVTISQIERTVSDG